MNDEIILGYDATKAAAKDAEKRWLEEAALDLDVAPAWVPPLPHHIPLHDDRKLVAG